MSKAIVSNEEGAPSRMFVARILEMLFERIMRKLAVLGSGVDLDADEDSLFGGADGDPLRPYGS